MAYLDETGLQHYQEAIRPMLVRSCTQEQYDALSEEKKRGLVVITDAEPEGGGACEEVYSTEETRIGRWIDGKPIYRMVVTTTVTNVQNINLAVYSSNEIETYTLLRGWIKGGSYSITTGYTNGGTEFLILYQYAIYAQL